MKDDFSIVMSLITSNIVFCLNDGGISCPSSVDMTSYHVFVCRSIILQIQCIYCFYSHTAIADIECMSS